MFGFLDDDAPGIAALKARECKGARMLWPSLTLRDLRGIKTATQFADLLARREHLTIAEARGAVLVWLRGYRVRLAAAVGIVKSQLLADSTPQDPGRRMETLRFLAARRSHPVNRARTSTSQFSTPAQ